MVMTIQEFCDKHGACEDGKQWAMDNCKTMQDVWDKARPEWLLWVATREGVLTEKEQRLFACWCVRRVWHLLGDERSKKSVEVAELYAHGKTTKEDLAIARDVASAATSAGAMDAAMDAVRDARAAAMDAAIDAIDAAQAKYIRENYKPIF